MIFTFIPFQATLQPLPRCFYYYKKLFFTDFVLNIHKITVIYIFTSSIQHNVLTSAFLYHWFNTLLMCFLFIAKQHSIKWMYATCTFKRDFCLQELCIGCMRPEWEQHESLIQDEKDDSMPLVTEQLGIHLFYSVFRIFMEFVAKCKNIFVCQLLHSGFIKFFH